MMLALGILEALVIAVSSFFCNRYKYKACFTSFSLERSTYCLSWTGTFLIAPANWAFCCIILSLLISKARCWLWRLFTKSVLAFLIWVVRLVDIGLFSFTVRESLSCCKTRALYCCINCKKVGSAVSNEGTGLLLFLSSSKYSSIV